MKIIVAEQLKEIKLEDTNDFKPAVKVQEVIGSALPRIGAYKKLDNKKQVVALIDDVRREFIRHQNSTIKLSFTGFVHQLRKVLHDLR